MKNPLEHVIFICTSTIVNSGHSTTFMGLSDWQLTQIIDRMKSRGEESDKGIEETCSFYLPHWLFTL